MSSKVLIVGAGTSGLVAALTLLKNGIPIRVIAKEHSFRGGQRGASISPRTLEIYKFLGVQEILEKSVYNYDFYDHAAGSSHVRNITRMNPWNNPTPGSPWMTFRCMGQNNAEAILRAHLATHGVEVELGTTLLTFRQDADHVTATITKFVDGEERLEQIEVDWLIGADGAQGVTRKALGLTFLGETRENEHMTVGDIHIKGLSTANWHSWGDRQVKALFFRPSEDPKSTAFQFVAWGPEVDHAKLTSDKAALIDFLSEQSGMAREAFGELIGVVDYRPQIRMVDKFGKGRVFVVGDAAHVQTQTGGQKMNSGVQDSFNLAWKLSLVVKSLSAPSLLDTYTSERLPVVAQMLDISTAMQKLVFEKNPTQPSSDTKWLERGGKLLQLGVNYRGSSIVIDETMDGAGGANGDSYSGDGLLRGGDRAPDAPELVHLRALDGGTTRFFDIFKPHLHTVLVFNSASAVEQCTAVLKALQRYPKHCIQSVVVQSWEVYGDAAGLDLATMVLKDKIGHAYQGYAVVPRSETLTMFIVRPDGVIGGLVYGVEGIQAYFDGILI